MACQFAKDGHLRFYSHRRRVTKFFEFIRTPHSVGMARCMLGGASSEVDGASPCVPRDMMQGVSIDLKCDLISEVQHGYTPSDVARINEDEIQKWMKSAPTLNKKLHGQWSSRPNKRNKYTTSAKYAAIMDYEHTHCVASVSKKHGVPRNTLIHWLSKIDDIKKEYSSVHKQPTNDGQHQSEDNCSSRATVEPTTDAPLDLRTKVTLQQRSTALPDDSDRPTTLVRSANTVAVDMKTPAQLDASVVTSQSNDVSVLLYSDAYRLCGSIEEMMALHGIKMDDVKTTAM